MHYSLIIILLAVSQLLNAAESIPSYQHSLNQFIEQSKPDRSPYFVVGRTIMKKLGESLAASMPSPGIKVGDEALNI